MNERHDPAPRYLFHVEIDGVVATGFTEVSGLGLETEVIEYREGAEPRRARQLPGLSTYPRLILRRGFSRDRGLWDWARSVRDGMIDRRSGAIVLLRDDGGQVARWNFREAWPVKYEGPALNAEGSEVAIETIELVHEGLE